MGHEHPSGVTAPPWLRLLAVTADRRRGRNRSPARAERFVAEHAGRRAASPAEAAAAAKTRPARRKLLDERHAITHKYSIAGHEGYITVGMYEDGKPGEIFLVMAKEGSTISGLMDAFATSISME